MRDRKEMSDLWMLSGKLPQVARMLTRALYQNTPDLFTNELLDAHTASSMSLGSNDAEAGKMANRLSQEAFGCFGMVSVTEEIARLNRQRRQISIVAESEVPDLMSAPADLVEYSRKRKSSRNSIIYSVINEQYLQKLGLKDLVAKLKPFKLCFAVTEARDYQSMIVIEKGSWDPNKRKRGGVSIFCHYPTGLKPDRS